MLEIECDEIWEVKETRMNNQKKDGCHVGSSVPSAFGKSLLVL